MASKQPSKLPSGTIISLLRGSLEYCGCALLSQSLRAIGDVS